MSDKNNSNKDRKYEVVPYDPNWPNRFVEYKAKLDILFGSNQIEHIGSTSVPGMVGKPCIDVLVIVDDLQMVENHVSDMEQAGFEYAGPFVTQDSRLFRMMEDNVLLANIHFFPEGHPHIGEMVDLRNYFQSHPEEVESCSNLKNELYSKYQNDYASYRKYKDEYMSDLNKRVSEELSRGVTKS